MFYAQEVGCWLTCSCLAAILICGHSHQRLPWRLPSGIQVSAAEHFYHFPTIITSPPSSVYFFKSVYSQGCLCDWCVMVCHISLSGCQQLIWSVCFLGTWTSKDSFFPFCLWEWNCFLCVCVLSNSFLLPCGECVKCLNEISLSRPGQKLLFELCLFDCFKAGRQNLAHFVWT